MKEGKEKGNSSAVNVSSTTSTKRSKNLEKFTTPHKTYFSFNSRSNA